MTDKTEKNLNVAWIGESGFPFGMAAIQKTIILGEALGNVGVHFTVINRKGVLKPEQQHTLSATGEYKRIRYVYTSGITYRPKNIIKRNLMKVKGAWNEYWYLRKMRGMNTSLVAIVSTHSFLQASLYVLYGKILNFPLTYLYVEMPSEMQHRVGLINKMNDYLFENILLKKMDGALPISELLKENYMKIAPGKSFLKIPTICNFENFNSPRKKMQEPYLLFCGAIEYREIIDFTLAAFKLLPENNTTKLYLIISKGSTKQYAQFNQYLSEQDLLHSTKVFSDIPFSELVSLYVNASALLIPLRPTKQDAARFPHKIAEYTATGNPIITTNYGEVPLYFKDGVNALIADTYDISEYAEKMKFVSDHPEEAKKIGQKGKELGTAEFSHINYGQKLKEYLQTTVQNK